MATVRARWVVVALLLALAPVQGAAQGGGEEAGEADARGEVIRLIKEANADYDAARFREALRSYLRAFELSREAPVLYRIGQTYEALGNYQRARESLEFFLTLEPTNKRANRIRAKIQQLRKLEGELQSTLEIRTEPAGAMVVIDGLPKIEGPTPVEIPVGTGHHEVRVTLKGRGEQIATVKVEPGQRVRQVYRFVDSGQAPEPQTEVIQERVGPADGGGGDPQALPAAPVNLPLQTVELGPGSFMKTLGWTVLITGNLLLMSTIVLAGPGADRIPVSPMWTGLGGLALFGLGGYILIFHDYDDEFRQGEEAGASALGSAAEEGAAQGRASGRSRFGVGVRLRF